MSQQHTKLNGGVIHADPVEAITLFSVLLIFLCLGLIQSTRLPISFDAWGDEMMFVDPAANLYLGHGFTSAAWYGQTKDEFWAGYPPLYSFLLSVWMRLFGFGLATARSLNVVLTVISAALLWLSVKRLHLVTTMPARVGLVLVLLFTQNYTFNFTAGRPDPLMLLLTVLVLLIVSVRSPSWRYGLLIVTCTLFPFTGLALVVYSAIAIALVVCFLRRAFVTEAGAMVLGLSIGLVGLYGFYYAHGVWDKFIFSTKNNPTLVGHDLASALSESMRFGGFLKNWNFQVLLLLLLGVAIYRLIKGQFHWRSLLCFGLAAGIVLPFGMRFSGAYLFYNGWMALVPLTVCLCSALEQLPNFGIKRWVITTASGLLLMFCLLGPHLRFIDLAANWQAIDYAPVTALVERNVTAQDWVFSDSLAYYAVKQKAAVTMTHWYGKIMPAIEQQQVLTLILRPDLFEQTAKKLGGEWQAVPDQVILQTRDGLRKRQISVTLNVYKRKE